jgi:hypothetical protein
MKQLISFLYFLAGGVRHGFVSRERAWKPFWEEESLLK